MRRIKNTSAGPERGWLLVLTGVVAAVHLMNQDAVECMVILQGEKQYDVSFQDLDKGSFSGELIDGKGDVTQHSDTGVLLKSLLESKGIDPGTKGTRVIVFGDENSRRCVRFAPKITLE